jgi:hypothetical protein
MVLGVMLRGLFGVLIRQDVMPMRQMGVVASHLVRPSLVMSYTINTSGMCRSITLAALLRHPTCTMPMCLGTAPTRRPLTAGLRCPRPKLQFA